MKLDFCPQCAKPLTKDSDTKYVCPNGHIFWNNPHTASTVALLKGNQALFSKRRLEPKKGLYDFPGGYLEFNENAYDATKRELFEETGLDIETKDLTLLHTTLQPYIENVNVCDLIFVATEWSGSPKANDDVAELEWKPIEFIDSAEFAWDYIGLVEKLHVYLNSRDNTL